MFCLSSLKLHFGLAIGFSFTGQVLIFLDQQLQTSQSSNLDEQHRCFVNFRFTVTLNVQHQTWIVQHLIYSYRLLLAPIQENHLITYHLRPRLVGYIAQPSNLHRPCRIEFEHCRRLWTQSQGIAPQFIFPVQFKPEALMGYPT